MTQFEVNNNAQCSYGCGFYGDDVEDRQLGEEHDKDYEFVSSVYVESAEQAAAAAATAEAEREYRKPALAVEIPGIFFSDIVEEGGFLYVRYLPEYIAGVYRYVLGGAAIIATVMIMIGGVQYIFGGAGSENISKAKTRISNAAVGLVLILTAYVILAAVNPALTAFHALRLQEIDPEMFVVENYETTGYVTFDQINSIAGIVCPRVYGQASFDTIAQSFVGKVAYRMGGKGQAPPYSDEKLDFNSRPYREYCPSGNACFDCSGFANALRACAGYSLTSKSTKEIFTGAEEIESCTDTSANDIALNPGDWIGYTAEDSGDWGHVYTYIGDGKVADSHGGGREPGTAIGIYKFSALCSKLATTTYRISRISGSSRRACQTDVETGETVCEGEVQETQSVQEEEQICETDPDTGEEFCY